MTRCGPPFQTCGWRDSRELIFSKQYIKAVANED